jgi:ParB-like nuclease domain
MTTAIAAPVQFYPLPPFDLRRFGLKPNQIDGLRPTLAWIDPALLLVDKRYQRASDNERSRNNIAKIIANFDWRKFQPCVVTHAAGGRYLVIDGQHRAIAAKAHPGVKDVPCWVVDAPSLADQARAFIGINADRVNPTPLALHKSRVAAEDADALRIKAVCDAAGVRIVNSPTMNTRLQPGDTLALGTIAGICRRDGDAVATTALAVLRRAHPHDQNELRANIIAAVGAFVAGRANVDVARLSAALRGMTATAMTSNARRAKARDGNKMHDHLVSFIARAYDGTGGAVMQAAAPPRKPPAAPTTAPAAPPKGPAPRPAPAREPVMARPVADRGTEIADIDAAVAAGKVNIMPSGADLREVMKDVPTTDYQACKAWCERNHVKITTSGSRWTVDGVAVSKLEFSGYVQRVARDRALEVWRARKASAS